MDDHEWAEKETKFSTTSFEESVSELMQYVIHLHASFNILP